jgi:hypothetical protein
MRIIKGNKYGYEGNSHSLPEGATYTLRKTIKNIYAMVAGSPFKIQISHHPNTILICYHYIKQFSYCAGIQNITMSTSPIHVRFWLFPFKIRFM